MKRHTSNDIPTLVDKINEQFKIVIYFFLNSEKLRYKHEKTLYFKSIIFSFMSRK